MEKIIRNYQDDNGVVLDEIVEAGDIVSIIKEHKGSLAGLHMKVHSYNEVHVFVKPLVYHSVHSHRETKDLGFYIKNIRLVKKANNLINDYSKLTNFGLF